MQIPREWPAKRTLLLKGVDPYVADMDDETAYQITKAAVEDKTVQANALASQKGVDLAKLTMQYATTHPDVLTTGI